MDAKKNQDKNYIIPFHHYFGYFLISGLILQINQWVKHASKTKKKEEVLALSSSRWWSSQFGVESS